MTARSRELRRCRRDFVRVLPNVVHGKRSTYNGQPGHPGCRCDFCTDAEADYKAAQRARRG